MSNGYQGADYRAWLLAHNYGFIPVAGVKYEEVAPTDNIGSHFFANTSNDVKIHIQYDTTKLEKQ